MGFFLATTLVAGLLPDLGQQWSVVVALALGIAGAVLALLVQRIAISVAGFVLGAYATFAVLDAWAIASGGLQIALVVIGGIVVASLAAWLFEVAVIALSSLVGAGLVVSATGLTDLPLAAVFLILAVLGISLQSRHEGKKKRRR